MAHILRRCDWEQALEHGEYRADSLNTQGVIHSSEPGERQLISVTNFVYRGVPDLLVLLVESDLLQAPLKVEEYKPGSPKFPHLHGPLEHLLEEVGGFPGSFDRAKRVNLTSGSGLQSCEAENGGTGRLFSPVQQFGELL